jgi:streptogramin lyase
VGLGLLAQLQPDISQVTAYTLPVGSTPQMIAVSQGRVWYTEDTSGTLGVLDPTTATGTSAIVMTTTATVTPDCSIRGPGTSTADGIRTGSLAWTTGSYTLAVESDGWTVYRLPAGASPWGLAVVDEDVFVVDQARQKLLRLSSQPIDDQQRVYLPVVIK